MLLSFSVENFRSFRDESVLDLKATTQKPAYSWLDGNVATDDSGDRVLKTKAIYGANASGKSNLILAIGRWQRLALFSDPNDAFLGIDPFSLDAGYLSRPAVLIGKFKTEGYSFEYGVEVGKGAIHKEWLYDITKRRAKVFSREGLTVDTNDRYFSKDDRLTFLLKEPNDIFRADTTFLSSAWKLKLNDVIANAITGVQNILVISDRAFDPASEISAKMLHENNFVRERTSALLKLMGIDVHEILAFDREKLSEVTELPGVENFVKQTAKKYFTITTRPVKNSNGQSIAWLSDKGESAGTRKMIELAPMIIMTLERGGVLIIDEFESQLHTRLSREIVELFNSVSGNPNNAQFIFSTHDTNLLDNKLLRRDQIDLVEKDEEGASTLYALSDIEGVRNDANFEKEYLGGSYGAVPDVRDLDLALDLETATDE